MKISRTLLARAALVMSFGATAGAQVTGALGGPVGSFLSLSNPASCTNAAPCTLGGSIGTIVGGRVLGSDQPFADIPAGGVFESKFLAAGPTVSQPATLTFNAAVTQFSFLWGSPDWYNQLYITTNAGTQLFTAGGLGFSVTNGNQQFSQYVQFSAAPGSFITKVAFTNNPVSNAFEVSNFSVVPEPSSVALLGAGLALFGLVSVRRKQG